MSPAERAIGSRLVVDVSRPAAYLIAVALTAAALGVQLLLGPVAHVIPFLFFFPAVGLASWTGGSGPGALATALSALAANYFFLPPKYGFRVDAQAVTATSLFVLVAGTTGALACALRGRYRERDELLRQAREASRERLVALEREQRARAAVEKVSLAKDEFLAMLGHELRNPLAPISTALQLVRRRGAGSRETDIIERQVQHLTRLVDDLLDVSRITRGKVELVREPLDVADVVARSVELAAPIVQAKKHTLTVDVSRAFTVLGDGQRLAQALGNIVINAAKYTTAGGAISITARRRDGEISISVKDTGVGMTPDLLAQLFDPFVQGPRTRDRSEGGLGLGLSLARTLVRLHAGDVTARSDGPGKGSELVMTLPERTQTVTQLLPTSAPPPPESPPRRVLVVDDNKDAADLLTELLRSHGHQVRAAHDGQTALQIAAELLPEVVLLDIGLPVMDGYEVAARLRIQLGSRVFLAAVTGYGQQSDRERSAAAGFDLHLIKPVHPSDILEAVRRSAPDTPARDPL